MRVTGRSQIFFELGGGSPVQVDFEPSIELAHAYRTSDISARARPQDRETPGFRIPRPLVSTKPRAIHARRRFWPARSQASACELDWLPTRDVAMALVLGG